jgi:hypothetical protein
VLVVTTYPVAACATGAAYLSAGASAALIPVALLAVATALSTARP